MAIKKSLCVIVASTFLTLTSCSNKDPSSNIEPDLNADGKPDRIGGKYGKKNSNYVEYEIFRQLNLGDGKYSSLTKIATIKAPASHSLSYAMHDMDDDGDIDFVFITQYNSKTVERYIVKNDGTGNFGPLEPYIPTYKKAIFKIPKRKS